MGTNINVTWKEYNGTDYDILYPATTPEQAGAAAAIHASTHAKNGSDPVSPASIGAPSSGTYPAGTDFNTLTTSGMYWINGAGVNAPSGAGNSGQILVINETGGGGSIAQMYFEFQTSSAYVRTGSGIGGTPSWNAWVSLIPSSGGTVTGNLAVNGTIGVNSYLQLSSGSYGADLPVTATAGRLFFKQV